MIRQVFCAVTFVISLNLGVTAFAGHINEHHDSDNIFPIPIPGQAFFTGGAMKVLALGPVEGSIITNTTFDVTYVSDGRIAASDLEIFLSVQVDNAFSELTVTGADLGFGSGEGTFTGSLTTDALNGMVWQCPDCPHSMLDLTITALSERASEGSFFIDSLITLDLAPPKAVPEPASLSLLAAGILALVVCRRRRGGL